MGEENKRSQWPKRSREELIKLLEQHRPELMPFTAEEIKEWLAHVEACGGYEGTAFGGRGDDDAR
jgi:hypothetical protein